VLNPLIGVQSKVAINRRSTWDDISPIVAKSRTRVVFCDVDETLISVKSMFDFLRYWMARSGDDGTGYRDSVEELRTMARGERPRSEINRAYYRRFTGVEYTALLEVGRDWYADYRRQPTAFVGATLAAVGGHRAAGDTIVLVSGSFRACLEPLAEDVGADMVVCSEPVISVDGQLTGEVYRPMIGDAKAAAVTETLAALGAVAADCFGYGDHSSDLAMLSAVGYPSVVGEDPVLTAHASRRGWPVLSAATGPLMHIGATTNTTHA
jgi:HAD superfamily hydrolase (TIGR01490 family)